MFSRADPPQPGLLLSHTKYNRDTTSLMRNCLVCRNSEEAGIPPFESNSNLNRNSKFEVELNFTSQNGYLFKIWPVLLHLCCSDTLFCYILLDILAKNVDIRPVGDEK